MSEQKKEPRILDMIPESLRAQLMTEVLEEIEEIKKKKNKERTPTEAEIAAIVSKL